MTENKNVCPCCPHHCDLSAPSCGRGEEYARTGVIPEKKSKEHGSHEEYGEHEEHGSHREHRDHGECGGHGKHGKHGRCHNHGAHKGHGKFGDLMTSQLYTEADNDGKLFAILQELGYFCRFYFDGKGGQSRILHILAKHGELSQKDLTERIGIQPGSASEILSKLERAGYITRKSEETDKRTFTVNLTSEGSVRETELKRERDARFSELFSIFSDQEKDQLLSMAEKLYGAWSQ